MKWKVIVSSNMCFSSANQGRNVANTPKIPYRWQWQALRTCSRGKHSLWYQLVSRKHTHVNGWHYLWNGGGGGHSWVWILLVVALLMSCDLSLWYECRPAWSRYMQGGDQSGLYWPPRWWQSTRRYRHLHTSSVSSIIQPSIRPCPHWHANNYTCPIRGGDWFMKHFPLLHNSFSL